jgi:serine/threonine-protein kinase
MIEKLGKYEIVEKIGVGGFGTVYRGRDPFIKRTVAVKTCQSDDDEIKKRFFREAELSGNLHHRNITTIYDFGIENGIPYIVQEYLTGEDLDKMIKRGEHIPLPRKIEILVDICEGLGYAHGAGIIHRDIKPSNIRILHDGAVKIMDFGIAKSFQTESNLTQTGITLGTAAYLAPEQIRGEGVDPRTDIFSLGVLAYELLGFQKPFRGEHISTVLFKILNEKPEALSKLNSEIPPSLEQAVTIAMEKGPAERYDSVADFKRDLGAILKQFHAPSQGAADGARESTTLRAVPREDDNSEEQTSMLNVTPPSGALARSKDPAPLEMTPSGPLRSKNVSLELVDFRDQSATEGAGPTVGSAALKEPKSKAWIFALAAVLVIAGGAAFYFLQMKKASPVVSPPGAKTAETPPVSSATAAPPPVAAPASTTAPESAPASSAAAPSKPEPAAEKSAPAREAPAPPRKFSVSFYTTPSSTLFIDGRQLGDTVPRQTVKLEEGPHRLRFELEDGTHYEENFDVSKDGKATYFHSFPVGSILITAGPEWRGAKVLVDSKERGHLPLGSVILASPGSHEIAIVGEGTTPVLKTVKVEANQRQEIHIAPPDKSK